MRAERCVKHLCKYNPGKYNDVHVIWSAILEQTALWKKEKDEQRDQDPGCSIFPKRRLLNFSPRKLEQSALWKKGTAMTSRSGLFYFSKTQTAQLYPEFVQKHTRVFEYDLDT